MCVNLALKYTPLPADMLVCHKNIFFAAISHKERNMRLYECVMIARQDVSSGHVDELVNEFCSIIENDGGSIKKREYWGLRSLAYRIKKNRKGHFILLNIETEPKTLNEFERIMGLNEDILRFMTVGINAVEEGPSVMMQTKSERPRSERGERKETGRDNQINDELMLEGK